LIDWETAIKLMNCFTNSFINQNGEFIAHTKSNTYLVLKNCKSETDLKCNVLEWFSRPAHKTSPYKSEIYNDRFQRFMLDGINEFLGTHFTTSDMEQIYTYLGNACNHEKTIRFIESGYDMSVLKNE